MRGDTLLIYGRGPSAFRFQNWSDYSDAMAVSSGIFATPEGMKPTHFVSMDLPKFFFAPIGHQHAINWSHDDNARKWPFWADADVQKHVTESKNRAGSYRHMPMQKILESIREYYNDGEESAKVERAFFEAYDDVQHQFGYQPGWGDYPNVTGWRVILNLPPNFGPEGDFGLDHMRNSIFMAVQVAHRLGYRNLDFVGVFDGDAYETHRETFARWHDTARANGLTWTNVGDDSKLGSVLPSRGVSGVAA